ncbi:MAG: mechanosensitive ion channel [Gammaproteobacteria bacterium]|nr:mechanosensitive ion channel [Gammaproteobacteria bacterium]
MVRLLRQRIARKQGAVVGGLTAAWLWLSNGWANTRELGDASLFKLGDTPVTAFGLLRVALILFVAIWVSRLFRHALNRVGSRKAGTQSAFYTVGRLAHYVIIAVAILIGLSSIGLSFANLAIVAGALGVGIGFGLQSIVNNFVSGLILLFERSLKVGDFVELESGVGGVVKAINVRSTMINTNDNLDILVPNSEFVSGRLTNWTLTEENRRMHIPFGVAYGTDKEKVKEAVLKGVEDVPYTVKGNAAKPIEVWLVNFGDSSLNFELIVWVRQAAVRNPGRVHAVYTWAIESALIKNGIEIPFPQRDLHIRSGLPPLPDRE